MYREIIENHIDCIYDELALHTLYEKTHPEENVVTLSQIHTLLRHMDELTLNEQKRLIENGY